MFIVEIGNRDPIRTWDHYEAYEDQALDIIDFINDVHYIHLGEYTHTLYIGDDDKALLRRYITEAEVKAITNFLNGKTTKLRILRSCFK